MQPLRVAAVQLEYAPNLSTAVGNFWLPEEPAAARDPLAALTPQLSVRRLHDWALTEPLQAALHLRNQRILDDQIGLRLKQILDYCANLSCDLVVFPEASVPVSAVPILAGYATTFAIFAGLGRIRPADVEPLSFAGVTDEDVHCNAALYLASGEQRVVTKLRLADGERAKTGTGLAMFRIHRKGRDFGIGAAICKDYLADDDRLLEAPYPVDILLISALTSNTSEFTRRTPRQLRIFANHGFYGGTCIQVPHLESLGMSDHLGSEPLPAGTEGVVVVDFVDLPRRVTSFQAAYNRVVARSAIVYDDRTSHDPDRPTEARIVTGLRDLRAEALDEPLVTDFLEGAARSLQQAGNPTLVRAIRLLRENQLTGTITQEELQSLTRHLLITDVQSHSEIRYAQIENLLEIVVSSLTRFPDGSAGLGTFRDQLLGVKLDLLSQVRLRYRTAGDRIVGGGAGSSSVDESAETQAFYGGVLGPYDAHAAVRSLPLQLDVLRTVAAENDPAISLSYRLVTTRLLSAELVPFFEATGEVSHADPRRVESLREGLGQLMGVAHAAAYSVSGSAPPVADLEWAAEIRPRSGTWVPPIKEDWAPLIDLLRAQEHAIELTLLCQVESKPRTAPTTDGSAAITPSSERFLDDADEKAAKYFASVANDPAARTEPANLQLRFLLRASEEPSATLIRTIGLRLIGSLDFEVVAPFAAPAAHGLRPSEALRIFHPPYGTTQGRGIPKYRETDIPLPAIQLPAGGVSIGSATLSSARYDRSARVRLDPESRLRHMYVIGRTGSGKTNFLKTLARQDMAAGVGVAVIDPHGDLVDYLLRHVGRREGDVLLLDFGDPEALPVLNPIDLDVTAGTANSRRLAIDDFIRLVVRQSFHQFYGPRFEDIVRLTLESLVVSNLTDTPTVLDVSRVLRSKSQRSRLVRSLDDPDLIDRWRNLDTQREQELAELIHWTLAKFSDMDRDGTLGSVLGGGSSSVSISQVVREGGILLVRIPEWEIGPAASAFIGGLIQERIRRAAFDRFSAAAGQPPPFYLYVDEFQKFSTSGFEQLVAEARKFGLGLVMAHQNLRQLEDFSRFTGSASRQLLESILGNVANIIVLGVSASDAQQLANELGIEAQALGNIAANSAVARVDLSRGETRTFTVRIPFAESDPGVLTSPQAVRARMLNEGYWRPREEVAQFMSQNRLAVEGPAPATPAPRSAPASQSGPVSYLPPIASSAPGPPAWRSSAQQFLDDWRRIRNADETIVATDQPVREEERQLGQPSTSWWRRLRRGPRGDM